MAEEQKKVDEEKEEVGNEPKEEKGADEESQAVAKLHEEAKAKRKKILVISIVAALLFALGVGVVIYLKKHREDVVRKAREEAEKSSTTKEVIFFDMNEILVNLNTQGKGVSFLKLKMTLEVEGSQNLEVVKKYAPKIQDTFQLYLRELRPEDMQGSVGLYRLKDELLLRLNKIVYPAYVNDILFKEVLVQ